MDAGDIAGAEAAYRRADAQGSVFGAYNLGILLQQRGDMEGAEIAWRHADERGDQDAAANLGSLLRVRGDTVGAEDAYRRADQQGSAFGSRMLGMLLQDRGDVELAEAAYRRAADRNDHQGAVDLGALLFRRGEADGAIAAYRRAVELGDEMAPTLLALMEDADVLGPAREALFQGAESDRIIRQAKSRYLVGAELARTGETRAAEVALSAARRLCAELARSAEAAYCGAPWMIVGDSGRSASAGCWG